MISILIITNKKHKFVNNFLHYTKRAAEFLNAEFVVAYDRCEPTDIHADKELFVSCEANIVENVLEYCYLKCSKRFVLRIDDDEILDEKSILWIKNKLQRIKSRIIGFNRFNLINTNHIVKELYPDTQPRLMWKNLEKRKSVHEGMPCDIIADGHILHYKFLIKMIEDREKIAEIYEQNQPGAGFGDFLKFNLPEKTQFEKQLVDIKPMFELNLPFT